MLNIIELKQLAGIEYCLDTLATFRNTSILGSIFYSGESGLLDLQVNDVQNTILAYRIMRRDTADHSEELRMIRNYFMEIRKSGSWRNTYEAALIIETILPDIVDENTAMESELLISVGDKNIEVKDFPYRAKFSSENQVEISRTGNVPVYLTAYQSNWNPNPEVKKGDFEIHTSFDVGNQTILNAGEEYTITAEVVLHKEADFVMITIPIPAGCSYGENRPRYRMEAHREYFRNETVIFCDHLRRGRHTFSVAVLPRYTGVYNVNPAKIELMYFPLFNANNQSKTVKIK